jgi:hypothetical protein
MLYNITENLQRAASGANKYMDVGIHENCEMTSVEYKQTEKGNEFIAFYFVNADNEQLCHTEWKVREVKPLAQMSEKEAATYLKRIDEQAARMHAIATTFIAKETYEAIRANSFKEFSEATVNALGDSYKGKKIRIKVIYDLRNFTAFPRYTNYTWIEPMSIPKELSTIKIYSTDKMTKKITVKTEGADNEVTNVIEVAAATTTTEDNVLPWEDAA